MIPAHPCAGREGGGGAITNDAIPRARMLGMSKQAVLGPIIVFLAIMVGSCKDDGPTRMRVQNGSVEFDDTAPLAAIRAAITRPRSD